MLSRITVAAALSLGALLAAVPVAGHPLGNFSINRYAAIAVEPDALEIRYLVDMAEIPTFQDVQEFGLAAAADHPGTRAYLARQAEALGRGLRVHVDGRPLALRAQSREISFAPGAADLPTMKLAMVYRAPLEPAPVRRLSYRDENFAERIGWREVVARAAPGVLLAASSVPERDRSRELSDYPADLLDNPPQVAEADIVVERVPVGALERVPVGALAGAGSPPGDPRGASAAVASRENPRLAAAPARLAREDTPASSRQAHAPAQVSGPPAPAAAPMPSDGAAPGPHEGGPAPVIPPEAARAGVPRSALTDLMTRQDIGTGLFLFTLATAVVLGAVHALEPGHGKTVVAAYLVGARGTAWHAVLLGLAVTVSHTAGVFLLGAVTLYASRYVMPDRLYPWLGAVSGLAIAAVGLALFRQRWRGESHGHAQHHHAHARHGASDHDHADAPDHDGGHHHHVGGHHHHHVPEGPVSAPVSARSLFALGLSGGIVPCPGALVVLLSALAWRRLGFGILLVVAFSVGLAAVLVGIGIVMVHARRLLGRLRGDGPLTTRWLPLASSAAVTLLGALIAAQALAGAGFIAFRLG